MLPEAGIRFQYFPVVEMVDFLPNDASGASMIILCGDFSFTTGEIRVSDVEFDGDEEDLPRKPPVKIGHESLGKIFNLITILELSKRSNWA